jgi:hypothetical protein
LGEPIRDSCRGEMRTEHLRRCPREGGKRKKVAPGVEQTATSHWEPRAESLEDHVESEAPLKNSKARRSTAGQSRRTATVRLPSRLADHWCPFARQDFEGELAGRESAVP